MLTGVGLAGCSSSGDDSGNGNGGDGGDQTSTPSNPASQLSAEGFATAEDGVIQAEMSVQNPTQQSVTADFSAEMVLDEDRGTLSSDPSEQTIPAGESNRFRVDIAETSILQFEELIGLVFEGFQLKLYINGESQPEACPDSELSNPNSEGCGYPFGLSPIYVEVEYDGNWQGAVGSGGNTRSVSRSSISYGAPQGYSTSYITIDGDANIVSANAQKQDDSNEELTIRIVHNGEVVEEQSTSSAYGVAQVSTNL